MPFTLDYSINGFPLNDTHGRFYVLDATTVFPDLQRRAVGPKVPGLDGEIPYYQETYETTWVGIKMAALTVPGKTSQQTVQAIIGQFTRNGPSVLARRFEGVVTQAECKLSAVTDIQRDETGTQIRFNLVVTLPGVWFRDLAITDWEKAQPVSDVQYEVTPLAGGTAPITDALVKLIGPFTTPVLSDVYSGYQVAFPSLPAGYQYLMDSRDGIVYYSATRSDWAITGTDYTGQVRSAGPGGALRLFQMSPQASGAGDIYATATKVAVKAAGITAASKIQIHARRCFI